MNLQAGDYNLSVTLDHNAETQVPIRSLRTFGRIELEHIKTSVNYNEPNKTMRFKLNMNEIGSSECLKIDFGDGDYVFMAVHLMNCKKTANWNDGSFYQNITGALMELHHTYVDEGVYKVRAACLGIFCDIEPAVKSLTITEIPCESPVIRIIHPTKPFSKGKICRRGSYCAVIGRVNLIDCEVTLKNTKLWRIYKVDSRNGSTVTRIKLSTDQAENTTTLILRPRFLETGFYRILFSVRMNVNKVPRDMFRSEVDTYIHITPTPLEVQLAENGIGSMLRSVNEVVDLDPYSYTVDPDEDELNMVNIC